MDIIADDHGPILFEVRNVALNYFSSCMLNELHWRNKFVSNMREQKTIFTNGGRAKQRRKIRLLCYGENIVKW